MVYDVAIAEVTDLPRRSAGNAPFALPCLAVRLAVDLACSGELLTVLLLLLLLYLPPLPTPITPSATFRTRRGDSDSIGLEGTTCTGKRPHERRSGFLWAAGRPARGSARMRVFRAREMHGRNVDAFWKSSSMFLGQIAGSASVGADTGQMTRLVIADLSVKFLRNIVAQYAARKTLDDHLDIVVRGDARRDARYETRGALLSNIPTRPSLAA